MGYSGQKVKGQSAGYTSKPKAQKGWCNELKLIGACYKCVKMPVDGQAVGVYIKLRE
jgi:hypothetical protein